MSYFDYQASKALEDAPFFALIMAAMRKADSFNLEALRRAFPNTWVELSNRYNAAGGYLNGEQASPT